MKKKFTVNIQYNVTIPVEVYAETTEDALDFAYNEASEMSLNDGIVDYSDSSIEDIALTDEPLTEQKETLIDRIKAILLIDGTANVTLNITYNDIHFIQLWASFDSCEKEIEYINVQYSFENEIYTSVIEDIPMDVLTEILKVIQNHAHNSK